MTFCPKHPNKWDQNLQFIYMYTLPKQDDEHHCHFYMGVHPPYPPGVSCKGSISQLCIIFSRDQKTVTCNCFFCLHLRSINYWSCRSFKGKYNWTIKNKTKWNGLWAMTLTNFLSVWKIIRTIEKQDPNHDYLSAFSIEVQGCPLRKIEGSPVLWAREIEGAQQ